MSNAFAAERCNLLLQFLIKIFCKYVDNNNSVWYTESNIQQKQDMQWTMRGNSFSGTV